MLDFDKLRSAVIGFWNFIWPALTTTFLWCAVTYWVAPQTSERLGTALKPFLKLPTQQTRETLTFFGIDKLIPLLTAFVFLLVIYLVGLLSERIGDLIPPYIYYSPTDLAPKLAGNVLAPRLKAHFNCTSDQEMWDRANEFASSLDPQESIAGANVQGSKKTEWAARQGWYRSKFFVFWTLLVAGAEIHFAGLRNVNGGRALFAFLVTVVISLLYFLRVLSAWKNSVGAVLHAAQLAVVDTQELRQKIAVFLKPDEPRRINPVFHLFWGPRFWRVMQPELFFNFNRAPMIAKMLGRKITRGDSYRIAKPGQ